MSLRTVSPWILISAYIVANGLNIFVAQEKILESSSENETLVYLLVSSLITAASSIILILWKRLMNLYDSNEKNKEERIQKLDELLAMAKGENKALREQIRKKIK